MGTERFAGSLRVVAAVVLCAAFIIVITATFGLQQAFAEGTYAAGAIARDELAVQEVPDGWQDTADGRVYYRDGQKLQGLRYIDGHRYYFKGNGVMCTSDVHVNGATFFIEPWGVIIGAKYNGQYFYGTMQPMTSDDAYDFETFIWARDIVNSITNSWDTPQTKLQKAFNWVISKQYVIHYPEFNAYETNWMARFARYHFNDQGGDCHADAAAFGYLAAAIGYEADVCIDAWGVGTMSSHSWVMIDNGVYDPLFAESKDYWSYYGATSGTYEVNPTARFRVPTYNPKHNAGAARSQDLINAGQVGLKRINGKLVYFDGNGQQVKSCWRVINGKRYYFKQDGEAATHLTYINGKYFLFDSNGVLFTSTERGTRVVKASNSKGEPNYYLVNEKGRTISGWSNDKRVFANTKGVVFRSQWRTIAGNRYHFDSKGVKARISKEIDGVHYVFGIHGALQRNKTQPGAKTALVRVDGNTYRVDKKGRAVASKSDEWTSGDKMRFGRAGKLYTGVHFVSGKFYASSSKGVYQVKLTDQLNAAVAKYKKKDKSAFALRKLLGAPVDAITSANCNGGQDSLWVYPYFTVITWRPDGLPAVCDLTEKQLAAEQGPVTKQGTLEKIVSIKAS